MKMKAYRKKYLIFALSASLCLSLHGCGYEEEPPKTDDATSELILPKGEIPSAEERSVVNAAKEEYEKWINDNK